MDRSFRTSLLACVLLVVGALAWFKSREPEPVPPPAGGRRRGALSEEKTWPYRGCTSDGECVYAENGCCGCANGARDLAVHRDQLAAFRNHFACEHRVCTDIAPIPPCGTGVARCVEGRCVFETPAGSNH